MIHYDLSPTLALHTSEWDVQLRNLHRRLRAEGRLEHDLTEKEAAGPVELLDLTPGRRR